MLSKPKPSPGIPEENDNGSEEVPEIEIGKDFICLTEFSEHEGPVVLKTYPDTPTAAQDFNLEGYALRIMSLDLHANNSTTLFMQDTQSVVPEADCQCYVHNCALLDLSARGFARPLNLSYITREQSKIMKYFQQLLESFSKVSNLFKQGNHSIFLDDIEMYLSKVQDKFCTPPAPTQPSQPPPVQPEIQKAPKTPEISPSTPPKNSSAPSSATSSDDEFVDPIDDLLGDFQMSHPFGAPTSPLSPIFSGRPYEGKISDLENSDDSCEFHSLQSEQLHSHFHEDNGTHNTNSSNDASPVAPDQNTAAPVNSTADLISSVRSLIENARKHIQNHPFEQNNFISDLISTISNATELKSELYNEINRDRNFKTKLRGIEEICGTKFYGSAMNQLNRIYDYFSRGYTVLIMEQEEISVLAPPSTLLSFGQFPMLNFNWECNGITPEEYYKLRNPTSHPHAKPYEILDPLYLPTSSTTEINLDSFASRLWNRSSSMCGRGLLKYRTQYPYLRHMVYSLLIGRPVVICASPSKADCVKNLITAFSIFVPGCWMNVIVPWQQTPLRIGDITRAKLIGLKKDADSCIPNSLKNYITVYDLDKESLSGPFYRADFFVDSLFTQKKIWPDEPTFLANLYHQLFLIGTKACVYYHMCCVGITQPVNAAAKTTSCRVTKITDLYDHPDSQVYQSLYPATTPTLLIDSSIRDQSKATFKSIFGLHQHDMAILQYFTDVIKLQQSIEAGLIDANAPPFKLHYQTPVPIPTHNGRRKKSSSVSAPRSEERL